MKSIRLSLEASPAGSQGPRTGRDGKLYRRVSAKNRVRPLYDHIERVSQVIDALSSPEFAATWRRSEKGTRDRLKSEADRLRVVMENLTLPCTAMWTDVRRQSA